VRITDGHLLAIGLQDEKSPLLLLLKSDAGTQLCCHDSFTQAW
jgi:hypothetical protein